MNDLANIKLLREKTGASMIEVKKALADAKGDIDEAGKLLRARGQEVVDKKQNRTTQEGIIGVYLHANSKIAGIIELKCETDFVARNEEFKRLAHDLAMHIVASDPKYLAPEDMPKEILDEERRLVAQQFADSGKPQNIVDKIIEGKLNTLAKEVCLLTQPFVKEPDKTVQELINEAIAKFGEKITVGKFSRFSV
ncbi:MAG: elongation factor Ts [Candidatus Terrybacteria bacterium RIFCSPLOWO2_01_FULL_44_24]|uniref:Elongation factor Ts n=1 Tax=Candidatus Terrybacteria bacterium RIFCSPHIGHO2_01_FULL_43_35 TaxID=1802361 RepID=A0A1G2PF52_9BACT|nr:MAG: elongation factor Ts [Candidatus Terrybacteria bacterium RIFCSPHIGHO2_01_FULL_43_35]OHA49720.1 MAG: elongation factor Ts [Candidatus Terrybacteria bacterium RIFCSPHIGHO2_02_FULL_43_14]OHA51543.1 MAG: elongation factor Ts [Candidatus Terrybacteria bacterium RIFCSPLOWO2_01_FULL_44_24]